MEDYSCVWPIYTNYWYWSLSIGLLFVIMGAIIWEAFAGRAMPWWVWGLVILGIILIIIGIVVVFWSWWANDSYLPEDESYIPREDTIPIINEDGC